MSRSRRPYALWLVLLALPLVPDAAAQRSLPRTSSPWTLRAGDTICLLGNALAERMQHHGHLESRLQERFPDVGLTMRNLGFSADELTVHQRTASFGSWDDYLHRCQADVIFAFFGQNESFAGPDGVLDFENDLATFIDHTLAQRYHDDAPPRLVLFSPIPHEDLGEAYLPDGSARDAQLLLYARAMSEVARRKGVPFVNLFHPMKQRYGAATTPLTINGVHLTDEGDRQLAEVIERALFGPRETPANPTRLRDLRDAILDKNQLWFNRYRATDGYNVYGGRSSLKYVDDQSNFEVLQRELEVLDAMCRNRDRAIHAIARGEPGRIDDSNLPPQIPVKTNKPGSLPGGAHPFPTGEDAIRSMTVADGMEINLFADERRFPELANPVQMAWDTRDRLWVAVWPTYPHWKPGDPMNDKLVILEDEDGDGRADTCKTFVGDLHNPTGFEFWNGGVLVANCPDLLFLKDEDGDDRVDRRERVLHGLSSADTHHSANSFVLDPGGALHFQEGTFHQSQVESIYGPVRCNNACSWRFDPRTWRVERYIPYNFANPHGHVFDRWGQDFITDGTGNVNYYALPFSGHIDHPQKHAGYFPFFQQRSRPCAGTEILSSSQFPDANQGNYLVANVIGFQGIFQYEFRDDGSGFLGVETEPIVSSPDPTFRPSDIEVGPDGAIYFLDWSNPIIGHMQHHLRDPSRDHDHGRVYRVTWSDRPLARSKPIAGRSIEALLDLLKDRDDRVRYRTRIELSGRDSAAVIAAADRWIASLDPSGPDFEHHRLEGLWLHQQHATPDEALLRAVLKSPEPRARAAAVRVLRGMRHQLSAPLELLTPMARDPHPRVRLETVVAASFFPTARAAAVALDALRQPTDKFLDYALDETMRALEPIWKRELQQGRPFAADNPSGTQYLLGRVSETELVNLPRIPAVLDALLSRHGVAAEHRLEAARTLAKQNRTTPLTELVAAIERIDAGGGMHAQHVLHELGVLTQELLANADAGARTRLAALASGAKESETRQLAIAALAGIDRGFDAAWELASGSRAGVESFLKAVPMVKDAALRGALYERVRPLMFHLPERYRAVGGGASAQGVEVRYYPERLRSAKVEVFDALTPAATRTVDRFSLEIPGIRPPDSFALCFKGTLRIATEGHYTFYTNSDDGSMLYIDGRVVVDNDGDHAMSEKSGDVHLMPGAHSIVVTFFDQAGAEGLSVAWKAPGGRKEEIPSVALSTGGADAVRDAAIRAMAAIPGNSAEKLGDAARLIGEGAHVEAALHLVDQTPAGPPTQSVASSLVSAIAAFISAQPAEQQTTPRVLAALETGRRLADALPEKDGNAARESLAGLGGSTVLIRTVPHEMLYDRREFGVVAGKPVAIVFQNNDLMPHNLVVTKPGTMESVGKAAEAMSGADPTATPRSAFIPDTPDMLWHTSLLNPGESAELRFVAPREKGDYPFVCTFPGHWRVMNGVMRVFATEADLASANLAAPPTDVGSAPARRFVKMWKVDDLTPHLQRGWKDGRDVTRGHTLFADAGCAKCHTFGEDAVRTGPPLAGIAKKYNPVDLLKEILAPSTTILDGYTMAAIERNDGSSVLGRVLDEDENTLRIIPYMADESEIQRVDKRSIKKRVPQSLSPMPEGLLVTLSREEILDLLAYLQSD